MQGDVHQTCQYRNFSQRADTINERSPNAPPEPMSRTATGSAIAGSTLLLAAAKEMVAVFSRSAPIFLPWRKTLEPV